MPERPHLPSQMDAFVVILDGRVCMRELVVHKVVIIMRAQGAMLSARA